MNEFQKIASNLLETDQVQVVIGYKTTSEKVITAAFIKKPADTEKLIFNSRCTRNLAVYLTKKEHKVYTGIGLIASLPVMRSVIQLAKENQVSEKNVKVIGITPDGTSRLFNSFAEIEECINQAGRQLDEKYHDAIQKIRNLPMEERWNYWMKQLSDCFKCYACRAACPMCYCTKCIVESNQPQWIPASSQPLANLEWHINRSMHMAGRCSQCDACADACPLGIPINLITRNMIADYEAAFGPVKEGIAMPNLLSSYNPADKETFIR